jgi:hypothetical protein
MLKLMLYRGKRPLKMVYKQCVWLTVGLVSLPAFEIVLEPYRSRGLELFVRLILYITSGKGLYRA